MQGFPLLPGTVDGRGPCIRSHCVDADLYCIILALTQLHALMSKKLLTHFFKKNKSLTVLSGAGISTASGIPDYRDRDGNWKHARPVQFTDFVSSESTRRRYWARSFAGWRRMSNARPNGAHAALANLEAAGKVETLITQNVDGLHRAAGSRNVIDLHGVLSRVLCMACNSVESRVSWQQKLDKANPAWRAEIASVKPDGDTELNAVAYDDFDVPACETCGGIVKPDVVFFGENVPRSRVATALEAVEKSDALLIVGSSLMVFSGFRFARRAADLGKPIAIINQGKTRADDLATLKIDADCQSVLA